VVIRNIYGRRHFIRVERDFLSKKEGSYYLPVALVYEDPKSGALLIELPHEAETGVNRLWIDRKSLLDSATEIPA
jgi:hypothetical protein